MGGMRTIGPTTEVNEITKNFIDLPSRAQTFLAFGRNWEGLYRDYVRQSKEKHLVEKKSFTATASIEKPSIWQRSV